jgi:plastocyanin
MRNSRKRSSRTVIMMDNMRSRLIAGVVLIVVGASGLLFTSSRARWDRDDAWGGPMMNSQAMRRHMMDRSGRPDMFGPWSRPGARGRVRPPVEGASVIAIEATEAGCRPDEVSVKAGEAVNITLVNRGSLAHVLVIPDYGVRLVAPAGQTATTGFKSELPGGYTFYCRVPGQPGVRVTGRIMVTP